MNLFSTLKRSSAMLMVFIYLISVVPKSFIHSVLADHQDFEVSCKHKSHKTACLKTAGVNCHFNDLVVNLPYTQQQEFHLSETEMTFSCFFRSPEQNAFVSYSFSKDSRGPPVA